jgi:gliding motility-associated lipoprotein GldD
MASCRPAVYPPKPSGYFRIDTPAMHLYQLFDKPGFPYTFEYPVYGIISNDTLFSHEKTGNAYWININFPGLGGVINITYKEFSTPEQYYTLINEAYKLSSKHEVISSKIGEKIIHTPYAGGTLFTQVGGNAASEFQFILTDSVKRFMYGALYFDVTPNADSLKPATDFLERDIEHMFWTLRWR